MISPEQGKKLIKLVRESINSEFSNNKIDLTPYQEFNEKRGVFVTLYLKGELRGCIGFPYDNYQIYKAVFEAAKSSAFEDPRFNPLTKKEFEQINIEVSVLTEPQIIESNYLNNIKIGEDGLIIKSSFRSGLLLPQVPKEYNWGIEEFLEHLSMKAGLNKEAWKEENSKIYKFQAQIFKE